MDAKGIINLGLGKLGAYQVNNIAPAVTPLEKRVMAGYAQWRDSELSKNRWVFARYYETLTEGGGPYETAERPYSFAKPNNALRIVREKGATWAQRGGYIYSSDSTLTVEFIASVPETDFDPLFIDTLAARIEFEMCEWVTQSNIKKADAAADYKDTLRIARSANALIIGQDDQVGESDLDDDWMQARLGAGL